MQFDPKAALGALAAALIPWAGQAQEAQPESLQSEVVVIVKVEGHGDDVHLEIPLPVDDGHQTVEAEDFRTRGADLSFDSRDGNRVARLTWPALDGRKRFTWKATVRTRPREFPVKAASASREAFPPDLARWTIPTPRLQSRSPLVRERLIRHLEPLLEAGERDVIRLVFDMVSRQFERRPDKRGTSNVLKAIRIGSADDRGLDRLLVTFLRTSGVPARTVGGIRLTRDGGTKMARWAEVWVDGRWVPFSVPHGWYGAIPEGWLKLWHGDRRFINREGVERLSFKILVSDPNPPTVAAPPARQEVAGP